MRIRRIVAALALAGALLLPAAVVAGTMAYSVSGATNVRSGPGLNYFVIGRIFGGTPVNVFGCYSAPAWCDSAVEGIRGWIHRSRLRFPGGGGVYIDPDQFGGGGGGGEVYIDPDQSRGGGIGDNGEPVTGKVLGRVVDRPGYCYILDFSGNSVIRRCPD